MRADLKDMKFFIVGTQHALKTDEGEYLALEVGVVEWSMKQGIHKTFHQFINPGLFLLLSQFVGVHLDFSFICVQLINLK